MPQLTDVQIKEILRYNTGRRYVGDFSPRDLHDAFGLIQKNRGWDNPVDSVDMSIKRIDGDMICNALWYEMSYNPVRFGIVSPFRFNGRNNIYRFCNTDVPDTESVIAKVRYKLIEYMNLNANASGQWNDVISAPVSVEIVDGHTNKTYKKLSALCQAVKLVAGQNVKDFKPKRSPYRAGIISAIMARHPDGVRPTKTKIPRTEETLKNEIVNPEFVQDEEYIYRLENTLDNLRITLDNPHSVSADQYQQALDDYEVYSKMLVDYLAKVYKR